MSTGALIGVVSERKLTVIQAYYDGDPDWTGAILQCYYNTAYRAKKLVEVGNIVHIKPRLKGQKNEKVDIQDASIDVVVSYNRDVLGAKPSDKCLRAEWQKKYDMNAPKCLTQKTWRHDLVTEYPVNAYYLYIYKEGVWRVYMQTTDENGLFFDDTKINLALVAEKSIATGVIPSPDEYKKTK